MDEDGSAPSKQARYSQAVKYYHKAASLGAFAFASSPKWCTAFPRP
jgi:hypothetical protein